MEEGTTGDGEVARKTAAKLGGCLQQRATVQGERKQEKDSRQGLQQAQQQAKEIKQRKEEGSQEREKVAQKDKEVSCCSNAQLLHEEVPAGAVRFPTLMNESGGSNMSLKTNAEEEGWEKEQPSSRLPPSTSKTAAANEEKKKEEKRQKVQLSPASSINNFSEKADVPAQLDRECELMQFDSSSSTAANTAAATKANSIRQEQLNVYLTDLADITKDVKIKKELVPQLEKELEQAKLSTKNFEQFLAILKSALSSGQRVAPDRNKLIIVFF